MSNIKVKAKFLSVKTSFGVVRRGREVGLRNYHRVLKNGKSLTMGELMRFYFDKEMENLASIQMEELWLSAK